MATVEQLYGHLKTLNKQWFYDKDEIDTELSDVVRTSNTTGLIKNDGTIDTTTYISEHQDISGKEDSSNKVSAWSATTNDVNYPTEKLVKDTIDTKVDITTYEDAISDLNDEIDSLGDDKENVSNKVSSWSGTPTDTNYPSEKLVSDSLALKADSSSLHTIATSGSYSDLENIPETFAPSLHEHTTGEVKDANAYTNLGTSANATQSTINYAIDTKIGSLLAVELIEVSATRPTASASTKNKLYLVPEEDDETEDAYEIFVTVESDDDGTPVYTWEKVDTARIDLSGYASIDHTHGNITNDGRVGSNSDYFVYTTTGGAVTSKEKIGNISTDGSIGTDTGKVVVTTTSGVLTTSDWVTEVDNVIQQLTTYGQNLNN